jgi:hypothetical protein
MDYGILFSHASEDTIPGLVSGSFPNMVAASNAAIKVTRAAGVRFTLVQRSSPDAPWLSRKGLTPRERLHEGINADWHGWSR